MRPTTNMAIAAVHADEIVHLAHLDAPFFCNDPHHRQYSSYLYQNKSLRALSLHPLHLGRRGERRILRGIVTAQEA